MTEPTTTPIRLLIADDHPVFRDGLASLLDPLPGIDVVARASDGAEAVALVDEHRPDVVIMDVQMPVMNGIDATRAVVAAHPEVGVLVLTMGEDDGTVLSALRAGARGYLRKGAEQDEIVRAVSTVHGGGVVFGASLAARIAEVLAPASRPERPFPELTERETEVLDLIAAGRSNGQIAQELFLSPKTIRNNITSILAKLQATDRADVIIRARDAGLGAGVRTREAGPRPLDSGMHRNAPRRRRAGEKQRRPGPLRAVRRDVDEADQPGAVLRGLSWPSSSSGRSSYPLWKTHHQVGAGDPHVRRRAVAAAAGAAGERRPPQHRGHAGEAQRARRGARCADGAHAPPTTPSSGRPSEELREAVGLEEQPLTVLALRRASAREQPQRLLARG